MKKSEMFNILIDEVCDVCEVCRDCLIQNKKYQAVVDARIIAVQYLRRIGLSSDDIALFSIRERAKDPHLCPPMDELKKKSKAMDKLFNSYSARCLESYAFCLMSRHIADFCRAKYQETYLHWMKGLPTK